MEKIEIALKGLDNREELEVKNIFRVEKIDVEILSLIEKSYTTEAVQIVKIVFANFNFLDWIRDSILWGAFTGSLRKLSDYITKQKPDARKEIVIKYERITIVLPNKKMSLENMLKNLPEAIKGIDLKETKSVWISYLEDKGEIDTREL